MPNHEWRVLPMLRALPDDTGMMVFIAAHLPLFALIIGMIASLHPVIRLRSRLAVGAFLIVHALLHALYSGHESYEFSSILSNLLIFGGASFGAAYLILEARDAR